MTFSGNTPIYTQGNSVWFSGFSLNFSVCKELSNKLFGQALILQYYVKVLLHTPNDKETDNPISYLAKRNPPL